MSICKALWLSIFMLSIHTSLWAQDDCERQTAIVLDRLSYQLQTNDFARIRASSDSLLQYCGDSELALRLQIIRALIQQESAASLIKRYQARDFDQLLVARFDYANTPNFASYYQKNKARFGFVPLRHPVDSLLEIKAAALLQSSTYTLNRQEEAICLLFAGQLDLYYQMTHRTFPERPLVDRVRDRESGKQKTTAILYSGVFFPLNRNKYQKTSPTFGITLMSPLANSFIFELGLKMRLNTKNAPFDFVDEEQVKEIHAKSSYFFGANLGYKIVDRGPWIILPKGGLGLGFINTKLSKKTFYDVLTDEEYEGTGIRYNNANTLHSVAGIAFMRHIRKKMYIGLELNYHFVPYNWDTDLITRIGDKFSSVELFLRF